MLTASGPLSCTPNLCWWLILGPKRGFPMGRRQALPSTAHLEKNIDSFLCKSHLIRRGLGYGDGQVKKMVINSSGWWLISGCFSSRRGTSNHPSHSPFIVDQPQLWGSRHGSKPRGWSWSLSHSQLIVTCGNQPVNYHKSTTDGQLQIMLND